MSGMRLLRLLRLRVLHIRRRREDHRVQARILLRLPRVKAEEIRGGKATGCAIEIIAEGVEKDILLVTKETGHTEVEETGLHGTRGKTAPPRLPPLRVTIITIEGMKTGTAVVTTNMPLIDTHLTTILCLLREEEAEGGTTALVGERGRAVVHRRMTRMETEEESADEGETHRGLIKEAEARTTTIAQREAAGREKLRRREGIPSWPAVSTPSQLRVT